MEVGVEVVVAVCVGVEVCVGVAVYVVVGVSVGVAVFVGVAVSVGVAVYVNVEVCVDEGINVGVEVIVGGLVAVADSVGVCDGFMKVAVGLLVGVGVVDPVRVGVREARRVAFRVGVTVFTTAYVLLGVKVTGGKLVEVELAVGVLVFNVGDTGTGVEVCVALTVGVLIFSVGMCVFVAISCIFTWVCVRVGVICFIARGVGVTTGAGAKYVGVNRKIPVTSNSIPSSSRISSNAAGFMGAFASYVHPP